MHRLASHLSQCALVLFLAACGGSPPSAPVDAGPIGPSDDAAVEADDAAAPIDAAVIEPLAACDPDAIVDAFESAHGASARHIVGGRSVSSGGCSSEWLGRGGIVRFTAPVAGRWSLYAYGQGLSAVDVRRECEDAGSVLACGISGDGANLEATFNAAAGETFFVALFGEPEEGSLFHLELTAPAPLDAHCDASRGCATGLVCTSVATDTVCAAPTAPWIADATAYLSHPDLAIAIDGRELTSPIEHVELALFDAAGAQIGPVEETAYVRASDSDPSAIARFYVRCVSGAIETLTITLVDASGARSEPMLLTPLAGERLVSGDLCGDARGFCSFSSCAEAADGELRCL